MSSSSSPFSSTQERDCCRNIKNSNWVAKGLIIHSNTTHNSSRLLNWNERRDFYRMGNPLLWVVEIEKCFSSSNLARPSLFLCIKIWSFYLNSEYVIYMKYFRKSPNQSMKYIEYLWHFKNFSINIWIRIQIMESYSMIWKWRWFWLGSK